MFVCSSIVGLYINDGNSCCRVFMGLLKTFLAHSFIVTLIKIVKKATKALRRREELHNHCIVACVEQTRKMFVLVL